MVGDADRHSDALLSPAHLVHRSDTGVGKPPPPTVPSMQNSGSVEFPERAASTYGAVQEGGGAEATALGSGGGKGSHLKGVQ